MYTESDLIQLFKNHCHDIWSSCADGVKPSSIKTDPKSKSDIVAVCEHGIIIRVKREYVSGKCYIQHLAYTKKTPRFKLSLTEFHELQKLYFKQYLYAYSNGIIAICTK